MSPKQQSTSKQLLEDEDDNNNDTSSALPYSNGGLVDEIRLFLELAVPNTLLDFGMTVSPLLTACYVGLKFGPTYLSAFTLANLTGNLSTFSVLMGLFSAADTLSPQAFGKEDFQEVGFIAMRGVVVSLCLLIPVNILLATYLEDILLALGQDAEASYHATQWYRIFVWALPFFVVFSATWKFLAAQHVMRPLLVVAFFSCLVILPVSLQVFTTYMGFLGSAVAYVVFVASQSTLLIAYIAWNHPHAQGTWPGLHTWREALQYQPTLDYLHLGLGGLLAQSEWVYWEVMGIIIGKLGVTQLSAHTIPSQVTMLMCMAPYAFGLALTIRMGITLPYSVKQTERIVIAATIGTCIMFGFVCIAMYLNADWIIGRFTNDEEVMALAHSVWWKVCLYNFNVVIYSMMTGIATGLGMQWTLGAVNFFYVWLCGVPITYYYAVAKGGGLSSAWTWINAPYSCINVTLFAIFCVYDWQDVQDKIHEDPYYDDVSGDADGDVDLEKVVTEKTALVPKSESERQNVGLSI